MLDSSRCALKWLPILSTAEEYLKLASANLHGVSKDALPTWQASFLIPARNLRSGPRVCRICRVIQLSLALITFPTAFLVQAASCGTAARCGRKSWCDRHLPLLGLCSGSRSGICVSFDASGCLELTTPKNLCMLWPWYQAIKPAQALMGGDPRCCACA